MVKTKREDFSWRFLVLLVEFLKDKYEFRRLHSVLRRKLKAQRRDAEVVFLI